MRAKCLGSRQEIESSAALTGAGSTAASVVSSARDSVSSIGHSATRGTSRQCMPGCLAGNGQADTENVHFEEENENRGVTPTSSLKVNGESRYVPAVSAEPRHDLSDRKRSDVQIPCAIQTVDACRVETRG